MIRKATAALAAVLVLAGCSEPVGVRGGQEGAPTTASQPPVSSTVATATATVSSVDAALYVCQSVDTAAFNQLLNEALAIGRNKSGPALRAQVAVTYSTFAERLSRIAPLAKGDLRVALTKWAAASTEVAKFVAGKKPRRGLVVDFGPAQPRWDAARKAAEKVCGHPLPKTH
jgi:hypothetical protein